jgi:Carboxypeptidase regulatory-like domain
MKALLRWGVSLCSLLLVITCAAQVRIVGDISGTVNDASGAGVPNAKVVLKDSGTGNVKETTSNTSGQFTFPDLSFGKFEITVTASGFQTSVLSNVTVEASKTTNVSVSLQVGQQTQSVTVEASATPLLETTSQLSSDSKEFKEINELPVLSRSALNVARFVPGASPPDNGGGDTRFNNMPGGSINVTVDGINNASNGFKSGGTSFFATAPVRLSAVEEVTVESAGLGADSGGMSGTNIKFITRRGGSTYHYSVFYQPVSELFNANSWSRNATGQGFRNRSRTHNYGGNIGGRLFPFGKLKDKLFFFANMELDYIPSQTASTRTVLDAPALNGTYMYQVGNTGTYQPINVLQIAAANGYPTATNPVINDILGKQKTAQGFGYFTPINNNFNEQTLNWLDPRRQYDQYPTTRLDYYATPNIQLTGTWTIQHQWVPGQHNWPGPDAPLQSPFRRGGYYIWSAAMNWTISPRTFNELRYGIQHSGDSNAASRPGYAALNTYNGAPMRVNSLPLGLSPYILENANVTGRHKIVTAYDTVTMVRGNHTITAGAQYRQTVWDDTQEFFQSPAFTIGVAGGDPLSSIFNATTMPGSNTADFSSAASLYALLVGRISAMSQTVQLNPKTLQYNGDVKFTWTAVYEGGLFVADRWRVKPNFTINVGLREELQGDQYNPTGVTAFPDLNNLYGPSKGLFMPGNLSGNNDPVNFTHGHAFKPDLLNFGPNIGFAWNPNVDSKSGILGKLFGGKSTVIRGGYSILYYDEGTQMWAQDAGNNPGQSFTSAAVLGTTTPFNSYLLNYAPGALPTFPSYNPVIHQAQFTFNNTFTGMNPDLRTPYTINWNFGIQRQLAHDVVLEVKYVGNQAHHSWRTSNMNEVNIFENGFLDEFKNAANNLKINQANGKGATFQNNGLAGQVNLPIFDSAFGAIGSTAAVASGSGYASTAFITNLQNGAAGTLAYSLATNSTYMCHMFGTNLLPCGTRLGYNAAGKYPINFFLTNPFSAGSLNYVDDKGWHDYNGLQVQLNKRFSHGLVWQSYYTFSKGLTNLAVSSANQGLNWTTLRNQSLDRSPSGFDIRHIWQNTGTYDLPIGKGRKLNLNNKWLDSLAGGWVWGNIITIRSGLPVKLTSGGALNTGAYNTVNNNDPGVILAPGVTLGEIQGMMVNTQANNTSRQTLDKSLIAADGRANPAIFITPTTPGVWGQQLFLYNKNSFSWDTSITKTFKVRERGRLQIWAGATNWLNHPNWGLGTAGSSNNSNIPVLNIQSTTFGQATAPANGSRSMQFRGVLSF